MTGKVGAEKIAATRVFLKANIINKEVDWLAWRIISS